MSHGTQRPVSIEDLGALQWGFQDAYFPGRKANLLMLSESLFSSVFFSASACLSLLPGVRAKSNLAGSAEVALGLSQASCICATTDKVLHCSSAETPLQANQGLTSSRTVEKHP